MGTVTAVISDTHIGSYTALSMPTWEQDTGEMIDGHPMTKKVHATPAQLWLLESWKDYWRHAWELCGNKHRLIVIHLGDIIDGIHHNSAQILPNVTDQVEMAIELLKPVANMAEKMYMIRGTSAHSGEMGSDEVSVARELGAISGFEFLLNIDGVIMDCGHQGRASRRNWTSAAASMATQAIMDAAVAIPPRPLPDYVFRGHNHIVDDSGVKVTRCRSIALPSWQLRTAFGYRVAAGTTSDIGGIFVLPNGALDLSKIRFSGAPGQREIIKV